MLEAVIVVLLQVLHNGCLYDRVGFVGRALSTVIRHEARKGIVELADRLKAVENLASIVPKFIHH